MSPLRAERKEKNMKMIKAVVRPEKAAVILEKLADAGHPAATQIDILGRGKEQGLKVGDIVYDEIPKAMIMIVADDTEISEIIGIITSGAKTGKEGKYGDGKIFVIPVEKAFTISNGKEEL